MNPFAWRREPQVALVLAAVLGAMIALMAGLMYHGAHSGMFGEVIWSWIGVRWIVFGALVGGGVVYTRQLLHT